MRFLASTRIVENVDAVVAAEGIESSSIGELRERFRETLERMHGLPLSGGASRPPVSFERHDVVAHYLAREAWTSEQAEPSKYTVPRDNRPSIDAGVSEGLAFLEGVHGAIPELINLTIGEIVVLRHPASHGGSLSSCPGIIWLNPDAAWGAVEYADAIFHEWIHNLLFFEDMVHRLFTVDFDQMHQENALVTSAILRTKRSLDKAYHSAAVAAGLAFLFSVLENRERVEALTTRALVTTSELREKSALLTRRGYEILDDVDEFLRNPSTEPVLEGFGTESGAVASTPVGVA